MWTDVLAFGLMALWMASIVTGVALLIARRRVFGALFVVEGLAALGTTYVLATTPIGIGESLLRVPLGTLAALALAALAGAGVVALIARRRGRARRFSAAALAGLAVVVPLASALGLYGLVYATTPERERERNPDARTIKLPPGFQLSIVARSGPDTPIDNPTAITFGPDGRLYLADISGALWAGQVSGDGTVKKMTKFADGFSLLVGLLWHDGELFAASSTKIEALRDTNGDGVADQRRVVASGLPSMILQPHSNNALTLGPDGRIYFGVGATDRNEESTAYGSAILSVSPDGGDVRVFARGFGNPFELAFNARGDMFAGDNALSTAEDNPPDELNFVQAGRNYGFPVRGDSTPETPAIVMFPPHAVPTGLAFYTGSTYPKEYVDNAFMTLWNRGEIVRVELTRQPDGKYSAKPTRFGEGFLYPIDITVGPDGNFYVADFGTSVVYRITYNGAR